MDNKLKKVIKDILDLPVHKISLMSGYKDYLAGAYGHLAHYGYELNAELAEIFIRELEIKLVGNEEVEMEWSEEQWAACEYIKILYAEEGTTSYGNKSLKLKVKITQE